MIQIKRLKSKGFTLIELLIAVAIVLILAGIAIPSYHMYIQRGYVTEAHATMSLIKASLDAYFDDRTCYTSAQAHPAAVPAGNYADWDPAPGGWGANRLNVRAERQVRFQYQVYASNSYDAANACGPVFDRTTIGNQGCVSGATISGQILDPAVFPTHWYLIVARGDLDGDGTTSTFIQATRNNNIIACNELE